MNNSMETLGETESAVIHALMKSKKIEIAKIAADAIRDRFPKTATMLDAWAKLVTLFDVDNVHLESSITSGIIAKLDVKYVNRPKYGPIPEFMSNGDIKVPFGNQGELVFKTMSADQFYINWYWPLKCP